MALQKIGIMSIGEMGFHWAKLLKSYNVEVLTYDKDRGEVSRVERSVLGHDSLRCRRCVCPTGLGSLSHRRGVFRTTKPPDYRPRSRLGRGEHDSAVADDAAP